MPKADDMKITSVTKKTKPLYVEFDDPDLLRIFKAHCATNDLTVKEVTERLVTDYLASKIMID